MDFTAAYYFDEEDRLNAMVAQEKEAAAGEKTTWVKRARYLVFG